MCVQSADTCLSQYIYACSTRDQYISACIIIAMMMSFICSCRKICPHAEVLGTLLLILSFTQ